MISIRPICSNDTSLFQGTSYGEMPGEAIEKMLAESLAQNHDGRYFEVCAVMDDEVCVGFVSLYETAPGEISCGPEIKPQYRQQGYGYAAVKQALARAELLGYTKAIAQIRRDNAASIALHQRLGFTLCRSYVNKKGHPVLEFRRPTI